MIKIVPMKAEHIDEVFEVECECFSIPWSKNSFRRELEQNELGCYIVAIDENDKVIAYAGMWHVIDEGHITNVAVSEESRRKGIGDMLVKELIEMARQKNMKKITLEVRISNSKAQRLYTKNGFIPEGIRRNYYSDTNEDAVIMWKYF